MIPRLLIACAILLPGVAGCAEDKVSPSPLSDQVLSQQYHARGAQGSISGAEIQTIAEAYRHEIARPPTDETDNTQNRINR
jgi:hypothetical protein